MEAAGLFAAGMSPPQVARKLRVSRKSAYVWHKAWRTAGAEALVSKGPGGQHCRLNAAQVERLEAALDAGPAVWGWAEDQWWTLAQVTIAGTTVRDQDAWICFEDEAGQSLRPPKARTWSRRGCTATVTVSGKGSGRVNLAGLICLKPGPRTRLIYRMMIYRCRHAPVADGLLLTDLRSELNPVETVWSHLKRGLGNVAPCTLDHLAAIIRRRLEQICSTAPTSWTHSWHTLA